MKSLIFALFLLGTATAGANSSCLKNASNTDLLLEIDSRLSQGGGATEFAFATYTCNGRYLTVSTVNKLGDEHEVELATSNSNDCGEYSDSMSANKGGQISTATIIATCNGRYLSRVMINANGTVTLLKEKALSNSSSCKSQALQINNDN